MLVSVVISSEAQVGTRVKNSKNRIRQTASEARLDNGKTNGENATNAAAAVFSNPTTIVINDEDTATPYPSAITVSGLSGTIPAAAGSVKVTLNNFNHTFPDDVGILLVGPTGAALLLQDGVTSGQPASNITYSISDSGTTPLPNTTAIVGGTTYQPATYYEDDPFPAPAPTSYNSPQPVGTATFTSVFGGTNPNGVWSLYVMDFVEGDDGSITGGWSLEIAGSAAPAKTIFDFDADGKADVSTYRSSDSNWYAQRSTAGYVPFGWGSPGDKPAPADYDGDGKVDYSVYRDNGLGDPNKSYFFIFRSSDNTVQSIQFGRIGDDPSVVGDWDGDGKADVAVYRGGSGTGAASYFYYHPSSQPATAFVSVPWGISGDKPVVGDYDGDGKADAAVFRSSNAVWYIQRSSDNALQATAWGTSTDKPIARDFDGDKKTDLTVFRGGNWYILQSANNQFRAISWGLSSDTPVPADYDGDGKADAAVFRNGVWYILRSSDGQNTIVNFGLGTDTPLPSIY